MSLSGPASGGLRGLFPIPLVAPAVLLVVLILLTPILFESGPPAAGSLEVQARLIVNPVDSGRYTDFVVRAVGDTVVYREIGTRTSSSFSWGGICPTTGLNWSAWQNGTNVLTAALNVSGSPIAIEVNATYSEGGQVAIFAAEIAFAIASGTLSYSACYGVIPGSRSVSLGDTPLVVVLQNWGAGGPPS
jgi:hypothetical protein